MWTYDKSKSHVEKWRVQYKVKRNSLKKNSTGAGSADILWKTISDLLSGHMYTIYVYAITTGDIVSQDAARLDITVSKCLHSYVRVPSVFTVVPSYMSLLNIFLLIYCALWCTIYQWKLCVIAQ